MSKVMILVGSGTKNSRSLNLAGHIEKSLQKHKLETELIDLRALNLPQYDATVENTDTYDAKTRKFLEDSRNVSAYVWVTPVYHNSFSSLLKTALDWQHFHLDDKVVGLVSHAGRSPQPLDQLLMVARAQHAIPIPTRVATQNDDYDDDKQLQAKDILERIEAFSAQMADFITRFSK